MKTLESQPHAPQRHEDFPGQRGPGQDGEVRGKKEEQLEGRRDKALKSTQLTRSGQVSSLSVTCPSL